MTDVAVDACCIINLLAAGGILSAPLVSRGKRKGTRSKGATAALNLTLHVPTIVAEESLYILQPDETDATGLVKAPIDLGPYIAQGELRECDIDGEEETRLFVEYAMSLDDGEAACLAIAKSRGWALATDDRPAATMAGRDGVPIMTTPELVKHWANSASATQQEVGAVLRNIQRFAKFAPRKNSPEAEWWHSHFTDG